jgi:hypothetical protein
MKVRDARQPGLLNPTSGRFPRYLPTSISLIFMRLQDANCWYASLCFAGANDEYLPWNEDIAGQWLCALFGPDRPRIVGASPPEHHESKNQNVRQGTLALS